MKVIMLLLLSLLMCSTVGKAQEVTSIVAREGTNMALALSPDGQWLTFDVQGTIYLLPATGGNAKALTDGMGDDRQPAWSADGKYIVFQSYRDGNYHIWKVNKDGTDLRQLTFGRYDDREPHCSADGNHMSFASDRNGNYDIWELTISTGELRARTSDAGHDIQPAYAPDGSTIAFSSTRTAGGIMTTGPDGREQLIAPAKGALLNAPAWSTDGSSLSFNSYADGVSDLMVVQLRDQHIRKLSDAGEDVFPFRAAWTSPQELIYSSTGKVLRRMVGGKSSPIPFTVTMQVSHSAYSSRVRDFDTEAGQKAKGISGPVISPDGTSTVFAALGDIWLLKHGQAPVQLTHDAALDADPAWTPDGKSIVFSSDRAHDQVMNLWWMNVQTGEVRQITKSNRHALVPAVSPDGKKIAFLLSDSPMGFSTATLHVMDIEGGIPTPYHKPMFTSGRPSWSSDGSLIVLSALQAYSSRFREGLSKVLVVPVSGAPVQFWSPTEGRAIGQRGKNGPVWSPAANQIAFVEAGVLWTQRLNENGLAIAPPVRVNNEITESPSWTADGKQLMYLSHDELHRLDVVTGQVSAVPCNLEWKQKKNHETWVIHAGQVLDGVSSGYRKNMDIVIVDNRIREIVPHQPGRSGKVVDASSNTVIPGLVEMHTHQNATGGERLGRIWLSYGITTVRETGGDPYDALERKEAWGSGVRMGPRLFFTGPLMDGERVYYDLATSIVSGAHLDMELNRADRLGYDFMKTYVRFPDVYQQRVTAFAHAHGIPVSSHEIFPATRYGVDGVEHLSATSRRGYSPKMTAIGRSYDDVLQVLRGSGMNLTPTISLQGGFNTKWRLDPDLKGNQQVTDLFGKDYVEFVSASVQQQLKTTPDLPQRYENSIRTLNGYIKGGVHITPGTDSPFITYGLSLHVEMQCLVDAGYSPLQAIQAATIKAAQALGVEKDLGTLEVGKLADLVIVSGDPLKQIKDVWKVQGVVKNGILYSYTELLNRP
jgi:Tol biopolymer transport system component/imidazolonepropionase-like amidohydrolase